MHCLSLENSRYDFARQTVLPFHWLRPKSADSANLIADLVSVTDPESKFGFDRMRSVPFCQRMEAAYSGPQWSILALLGKTANSFVDFVGAQSRIHEKWSSAVGTMVGSFSRVAPRFLKAVCKLYRTCDCNTGRIYGAVWLGTSKKVSTAAKPGPWQVRRTDLRTDG